MARVVRMQLFCIILLSPAGGRLRSKTQRIGLVLHAHVLKLIEALHDDDLEVVNMVATVRCVWVFPAYIMRCANDVMNYGSDVVLNIDVGGTLRGCLHGLQDGWMREKNILVAVTHCAPDACMFQVRAGCHVLRFDLCIH